MSDKKKDENTFPCNNCGFYKSDKWKIFVEEQWPKHLENSSFMQQRIEEIYESICVIRMNTNHLQKLDSISGSLLELKDGLLKIVSGKNVIDIDTVKDLVKAQQATYLKVITVICTVFLIVVITLLGLKTFIPHLLS